MRRVLLLSFVSSFPSVYNGLKISHFLGKRKLGPDKQPRSPYTPLSQSWLGDMYCLADHQAAMHDKKQHNWVEFK